MATKLPHFLHIRMKYDIMQISKFKKDPEYEVKSH